jgi:glycosyltransferase involved in cell wall biosynthesis
MPAVSIAIRAFRRRWLAEAIASVLAQTYRDLELVVYDDAGDLDDLAVATGDPRVRYHRAESRLTASGRFAAAVALCRGHYVGVLDDDDAYAPDFVAELAAALDAHPRAAIAFCRPTWDTASGRVRPRDDRPAGVQADAAAAMLRDGWTVTPSQMLFRRAAFDAALGGHGLPSGVAPDVYLNVRLALAGWQHVLVDAPLVVSRWHDGQSSRASLEAADRAVITWRALHLEDPVLAALRDRRLARALVVRAGEALRAGDAGAARADLEAARAAGPGEWPARRRAMALAAGCGSAGVLAARVAGALRDRWRRPPSSVGS